MMKAMECNYNIIRQHLETYFVAEKDHIAHSAFFDVLINTNEQGEMRFTVTAISQERLEKELYVEEKK